MGMEVRKVRFEAFKSLYGVECDLDHLTVLTGPNGSGKSNFVEALHFLGEVYAHGLEFAVSRAGGYDNLAHRRTRRAKHPISVMVEVVITAADFRGDPSTSIFLGPHVEHDIADDYRITYRHSFAMKTAGQSLLSDFTVKEDRVEVLDQNHEPIAILTGGTDATIEVWTSPKRLKADPIAAAALRPFGDKRYLGVYQERTLLPTALITDQMFYANLLFMVKRALAGTNVFQLSPFQCRTAGVSTPNAVLERHGENLPGAADHLWRNDSGAWKQVQGAMRSILPDLIAIEIVHTEDRRLALQFRERGLGRPWNTGEVSDGTIQALALFIALYDQRTPLLVVEEPENSVHPWILRQFLDLVRNVAGKQVVLTTHSPVLLNYVSPEMVRLISMSNGRSQIGRLLDASAELQDLVKSGDLSLFDAYDSGVLIETVPRGLAPSADLAGGELDR
jgi:predicted ATPase